MTLWNARNDINMIFKGGELTISYKNSEMTQRKNINLFLIIVFMFSVVLCG